ncbi:hypothetical protein CPC08DRAFT_769667 [Agrocybe pediades]|nr:hypothetical protein CPC08DRAFT_769667 [Agrocybe pediades]
MFEQVLATPPKSFFNFVCDYPELTESELMESVSVRYKPSDLEIHAMQGDCYKVDINHWVGATDAARLGLENFSPIIRPMPTSSSSTPARVNLPGMALHDPLDPAFDILHPSRLVFSSPDSIRAPTTPDTFIRQLRALDGAQKKHAAPLLVTPKRKSSSPRPIISPMQSNHCQIDDLSPLHDFSPSVLCVRQKPSRSTPVNYPYKGHRRRRIPPSLLTHDIIIRLQKRVDRKLAAFEAATEKQFNELFSRKAKLDRLLKKFDE